VKIVKPPSNGDEVGVKNGQSSTSSATTTPRKGEWTGYYASDTVLGTPGGC
jgi:hypothetical protein